MTQSAVKAPRPVFPTVFAFPPNRDIMGGTAYFIVENSGNILIDCPAWDEANQTFLQASGGVRWLFLTHRGAIGKVKEIQQAFRCEVVIQEQEAYLLPGLTLTTFQHELSLSESSQIIWTPGHTPGSACLNYRNHDRNHDRNHGGVLFTGRHLLPDRQGNPVPLRIAKTFHWRRQLDSVRKLRHQFSAETLQYVCPGANTGFLRGERYIDRAYERLLSLDLEQLLQAKPML